MVQLFFFFVPGCFAIPDSRSSFATKPKKTRSKIDRSGCGGFSAVERGKKALAVGRKSMEGREEEKSSVFCLAENRERERETLKKVDGTDVVGVLPQ